MMNKILFFQSPGQLDFRTGVTLRSAGSPATPDRKSTRLNSSHITISYAVFCLKKKKTSESGTHGARADDGEQQPDKRQPARQRANYTVHAHARYNHVINRRRGQSTRASDRYMA